MANPFQPLKEPNKVPVTMFEDKAKNEIIEYGVRDKVIKTGDSEYDFRVESETYIKSRCNRMAYVDSFKDDVGVLNILKKVQLTGDNTLLNQRSLPSSEGVIDVDNYEDNIDIYRKYDNAQKLFDSIPTELRKDMTIEQFLKNVKAEDIINFFSSKNTDNDKKQEEKQEDK